LDGREYSLEQQVWGPLLASNEMAAPSVGHVVEKISRLADYGGLFERAFGRKPGMETIGMALAAYERSLNAAGSPFDRWRYGGEKDALPPLARRGFELFTGKAGCAACHLVGPKSALFTDHGLHNTGVGYRAAVAAPSEPLQINAAPGVTVRLEQSALAAISGDKPNDLGRYAITQDPDDRWKFRTPSLRNVALTAPYMHDGSVPTLKDVVRFYNVGGIPNETIDALIKPLGLTDAEMDALVTFLEGLTGQNVGELVSDALAAPIGDPR
jgi:cytochrome c peroxidase